MIGILLSLRQSTVPILLVGASFTHGYVTLGCALLILLILDAVVTIRVKLEELWSRGSSTPELEKDLRRYDDRLL